MEAIIIFGAKYFVFVGVLVAAWVFVRAPRNTQKNMVVLGIISLPLMYVVAKFVGHFYFDPRPFVSSGITPLIPHAPDNGFPSDHTLLAAALACIMFPFRQKAGLLLAALTVLVGISRVLAGVHHTVDVAGSIGIAVIVTAVVFFVTKRYRSRLGH